ncbi:Inositol-1-monophosphatase [Tritonibacter multivorans]|uniref:Inositol-1-monophosphatase n=1 Tax=Tritonibacter multivorans TaxID=928856 RepID=A0A0P1GD28_9RHOB|nr:3'(2'),5'-bisphosphate nucleotidase CysQ [Tritonibacter multivorans]MDA7419940.1 3'(2'),5'-bisphosphate nucleotidase CysQ [Tritonibacter multivorans]CUH79363.1 Inositol-1-monophosphatase [Tritonibacter multivorans]SFC10981.1 myo-inositol-1(or 4)-monophosphatase [Tritonibacter multivorans]
MPATEYTNDLALLTEAALAAGEVACQFTGPEAQRWDKPDGAGPVTEADLAVNRLLEDRLQAARPEYGWLSEESEDGTERLSRERVFVVDPIDGTRSFAEGSHTWAHSIAVVENGAPVAAVVYLPKRDLLFTASRGAGASLNGTAIQISRTQEIDRAHVLSAKPAMAPTHWKDGQVPGFQRSHRPSLAYRLSRVADGSYDAMLTLRPTWEWDIAAGVLILSEAGGHYRDRAGERLRFNSPSAQQNGLLAGSEALCEALLTRLAGTATPS